MCVSVCECVLATGSHLKPPINQSILNSIDSWLKASYSCNFVLFKQGRILQGHLGSNVEPSWDLQGLEATSRSSQASNMWAFFAHHVPNSWLRRTWSAQTAAQHFDFLFKQGSESHLAMIKPRSADRGICRKVPSSTRSTLGACLELTSASSISMMLVASIWATSQERRTCGKSTARSSPLSAKSR